MIRRRRRLGVPFCTQMIGLAWKHDNIYIDTSAHLPRYYPPQLVHFAGSYGRRNVIFATNWRARRI